MCVCVGGGVWYDGLWKAETKALKSKVGIDSEKASVNLGDNLINLYTDITSLIIINVNAY